MYNAIPMRTTMTSLPFTVVQIEDICAICLDTFDVSSHVVVSTCCHKEFHTHCLHTWTVQNPICPLCRQSVVVKDIQSNNEDAIECAVPIDNTTTNINEIPSARICNLCTYTYMYTKCYEALRFMICLFFSMGIGAVIAVVIIVKR